MSYLNFVVCKNITHATVVISLFILLTQDDIFKTLAGWLMAVCKCIVETTVIQIAFLSAVKTANSEDIE